MPRRLPLLAAALLSLAVAAPAALAAPAPAPAPVAQVAAAAEGAEPVPTPTVTGPIAVTDDSYPFLSTDVVDAFGYVEEEYFLEGVAFDHLFQVDSPYKTRIVVRRPADPTRSSGTTVLEWTNVTGGYDQEYEWFTSHEHFMRSGITWVGLSNQYVGVQELKRRMPHRYSSLRFDGDGASEDVLSQAAQALLAPADVDPLAGLRPELLLAAGHSQSGTKLAGYYNDVQPRTGLFDGFMIRGIEAAIDTDEVRVPVLRVQTETDFTEGSNRADTDSEFYRRWDVAGASHVDKQQVTYKDPLVLRDRGSQTPVACVTEPYSRIPFQHALNAGYDAMVRWVRTGTPPPESPRFQADGLDRIERDEHGNALGGIRLPQHAVPTATNTGDNTGVGFCILYGSYEPFGQETLAQLYPTHDAYVAAVEAAAAQAVQDGFLLPADAERSVAAARAADLGLPSGTPAAAPGPAPSADAPSGSSGAPSGTSPSTAARALPATGLSALPALAGLTVLLAGALARRARHTAA